RVCLRLPAYSASAKVICFMEKLGWRDRRISPDSGSLFQTFPRMAASKLEVFFSIKNFTAAQRLCTGSNVVQL
ncbi:hypothetical protein RXP19_31490, partial [Pseudomonas aeruginosa]|nr:hypothetical protein [Pseudomonas aeruginosa]MEB5097779.1 hypothetical protein [Pseudomonas aeruginosa]MEB5109769.1 hypothetical protein [Pseudomonas aeruginosa]MEB5161845.1 hypothetical protein [Pseudomonas aeruginosa]MEB5173714.1 hypothetical protein [Pseudomonas aeruginosa]